MSVVTRRLRRHAYLVALSLCATVLFATYASPQQRPAWLDRFENLTYDLRLRLTLPHRQERHIVIVDVDERSLQQEGRWPWPRDRLARLVDILFDDYRVNQLGFDMVFAEPDRNPGLEAIATLQGAGAPSAELQAELAGLAQQVDRDARFAASLKDRKVVLGYYFQSRNNINAGSRIGQLPEPVLPLVEAGMDGLPLNLAVGYGANLPQLQQAVPAAGFFDNPSQDDDGVIRAVPLLVEYQGGVYESFALAMARVALGGWFIAPELALDAQGRTLGLEALGVEDRRVPVDDGANALVPYLGRQGSFPYVSASDVLQGKVAAEILRDAMVLVGTTSPGLQDLRSTPVQGVYPGVEVHANLIAGILDGRIRHRPGYAAGMELVTLVVLGLLLTFLFPWMSALFSILVTAGLLGLVINLNLLAWDEGLVLPLASSLYRRSWWTKCWSSHSNWICVARAVK